MPINYGFILYVAMQLAGPLSEAWASGRGPTAAQLNSVLTRNGVDPEELRAPNKQETVRRAIKAASDDRKIKLIEDLVELLRITNFFENESDLAEYATRHLREAVEEIGGELDPWGRLTWPNELQQDQPAEPQKPILVPHPPQTASPSPAPSPGTSSVVTASREKAGTSVTNTLFLVHGRDAAVRDRLEARLRRWEIQPPHKIVILDLEASKGQTLIDKFEEHASTSSFVVVIATPDDLGRLNETGTTDEPRARQNVIFEMGYFFAKLGRGRVVVMNGGIKEPSDITGVTYIHLDDPEWPARLARELQAAGMTGDWVK